MSDSRLVPRRGDHPAPAVRPILWQARQDLTEFSKAQVIPALAMGIGTFITAWVSGQITSWGSALVLVFGSVVVGVILYALLAIVRAPFIVIGQHHRQILDVNQRLIDVEARYRDAVPLALPPETPKVEPEANLVCLRCEVAGSTRKHSSGMFVEGPYDVALPSETITYIACVAVIDNKTDKTRKVGTARNVTARIMYPIPNRGVYEVGRGAWLSQADSKVTFYPSRGHRLILTVMAKHGPFSLEGVELKHSDTYGLTAETVPLQTNEIEIDVALESEGTVLKQFHFVVMADNSGRIASKCIDSEA